MLSLLSGHPVMQAQIGMRLWQALQHVCLIDVQGHCNSGKFRETYQLI